MTLVIAFAQVRIDRGILAGYFCTLPFEVPFWDSSLVPPSNRSFAILAVSPGAKEPHHHEEVV
jgi:hypothetical protein